ncbi:MAG TPA: DUF819 family protein [Planctomycetota bacterium]|nr:DUF819 family protein [Planctomycetota bacterium]
MIEQPLGLLAVLAAAVGIAVRLERAHRLFAQASAGLLAIFLGAAASNLGLVPAASRVNDAVFLYVAPAAIVLLLLRVRLVAMRRAGPSVLAAFVLASAATAVGCVAGYLLLRGRLGPEGWKLAGMFTATYIGGSINFVAVEHAYPLPPFAFAAANAADVAATALWMGATIVLPRLLRPFFPPLRTAGTDDAFPRDDAPRLPSTEHLAALAAIVFGTLLASSLLASRYPAIPVVLWATTIALLLAQIPSVGRIPGIEPAGTFLIYLFLATIGVECDLPKLRDTGMDVFVYASLAIGIHGAIVFGAGRLLRLPVEALALASNATVGGPATAMALARSQGWSGLVLPGVLAGLLGYAVGTYAGVGVCELLRPR